MFPKKTTFDCFRWVLVSRSPSPLLDDDQLVLERAATKVAISDMAVAESR